MPGRVHDDTYTRTRARANARTHTINTHMVPQVFVRDACTSGEEWGFGADGCMTPEQVARTFYIFRRQVRARACVCTVEPVAPNPDP